MIKKLYVAGVSHLHYFAGGDLPTFDASTSKNSLAIRHAFNAAKRHAQRYGVAFFCGGLMRCLILRKGAAYNGNVNVSDEKVITL